MGYTVELNQIFCAASEQAGQKPLVLVESDGSLRLDPDAPLDPDLDPDVPSALRAPAAAARDLGVGTLDNSASAFLRRVGDRLGGAGDGSGRA